jgi:hypothetical protein
LLLFSCQLEILFFLPKNVLIYIQYFYKILISDMQKKSLKWRKNLKKVIDTKKSLWYIEEDEYVSNGAVD